MKGEKRRRRKKKKKKRRRGRGDQAKKVWNLDFGMETEPKYGCLDFGLELYGFVWISCLDICLWVVGCRKPNPRMN